MDKFKNTPHLWDKAWKEQTSTEEDVFNLLLEENSIRWKRIENIITKKYGNFKLNVIEVGAGAGTNALLMAKRGAAVTVLDYSEEALRRSQEFFERNGLSATYSNQDALSLPVELLGKYDISMSFGLTEHFKYPDRLKIHRSHFDLLNKTGMTFIAVPNKYNLKYRLWLWFMVKTGNFRAAEEYPFSRLEFKNICQQLGVTEYTFLGNSLFDRSIFIHPYQLQDLFKITKNPLNIKKQRGTFLDQFLSYSLVLCANRPHSWKV